MLNNSQFKKGPDDSKFSRMLLTKSLPLFPVRKISKGNDVNLKFILDGGMDQPCIIVDTFESIGMTLPKSDTTLHDIASIIGHDTSIKLIEVGKQNEINGYTIGDYANYFKYRTRDNKVINLISLEFSATPLASKVQAPKIVRDIDWIDLVWPIDKRARGDFPQVQKYCLCSCKDSYTDFHVDFGGTTVWYHVLSGSKRFYVIPPTTSNLQAFVHWTSSAAQESSFFGDLVDKDQCFYLDLFPGQTLLLPSAWIHAVYTPEDSLVFGGNYLHSCAILRQLQVYVIEQRTQVGKEYRFPYFRQINFYFLCTLLPALKKRVNNEDCNSDGDDYDDLMYLCDMSMTSSIIRQYPFLLKACDLWIQMAGEEDAAAYYDAASSIDMEPTSVISEWWDVVYAIGETLGSDVVAHIERVRYLDMFDLLDETVIDGAFPENFVFNASYSDADNTMPECASANTTINPNSVHTFCDASIKSKDDKNTLNLIQELFKIEPKIDKSNDTGDALNSYFNSAAGDAKEVEDAVETMTEKPLLKLRLTLKKDTKLTEAEFDEKKYDGHSSYHSFEDNEDNIVDPVINVPGFIKFSSNKRRRNQGEATLTERKKRVNKPRKSKDEEEEDTQDEAEVAEKVVADETLDPNRHYRTRGKKLSSAFLEHVTGDLDFEQAEGGDDFTNIASNDVNNVDDDVNDQQYDEVEDQESDDDDDDDNESYAEEVDDEAEVVVESEEDEYPDAYPDDDGNNLIDEDDDDEEEEEEVKKVGNEKAKKQALPAFLARKKKNARDHLKSILCVNMSSTQKK